MEVLSLQHKLNDLSRISPFNAYDKFPGYKKMLSVLTLVVCPFLRLNIVNCFCEIMLVHY